MMRMGYLLVRCVILCGLFGGLLSGCARGCTSERPPIHIVPDMDHQPKYRPQAVSAFFYDGATMRIPVVGTVARGELFEDDAFYAGKDADGNLVATSPVQSSPEVLARGKKRFGIYCAPCHGERGDGKGVLFERANVPTPGFDEERLRQLTDGQYFDTISNGTGMMPGYRYPLSAADRWDVIAYVRELQRTRPVAGAAGGAPAAAPAGAEPGAAVPPAGEVPAPSEAVPGTGVAPEVAPGTGSAPPAAGATPGPGVAPAEGAPAGGAAPAPTGG